MDLENFYTLNFSLMQYHKYSLAEIENMMPWERDIYVAMLKNHLEEKLKQQQMGPEELDNLLASIRAEGTKKRSALLCMREPGAQI